MKKQLLTLLILSHLSILLFLLVSCSKNKNQITEPNQENLGNNDLVKKLNLQIKDKSNLTIEYHLLTTKKGDAIITGKQNGHFWIGVFDKLGNQLLVKRYDDDPQSFIGFNGRVIIPKFTLFYKSPNYFEDYVFITRQLSENNNLSMAKEFVEVVSKIDLNNYTLSSKRSTVVLGNESYYTKFIGPWTKGKYIATKSTTNGIGKEVKTQNIIYDSNDLELNKFNGDISEALYYHVYQETDFITITNPQPNAEYYITLNNIYSGQLKYNKKIYDGNNGATELHEKSINVNTLILIFKHTDINNKETFNTVNIDLKTGDVI